MLHHASHASTLLLALVLTFAACQSEPASKPVAAAPVEATPALPPTPALDSSLFTFQDGHIVVTWTDLARISFKPVYNEAFGENIDMPVFSDHVRALDGQRIIIGGYIIPLEETGDETLTILSAFPFSQCFFCGEAGTESVMDILPAKPLPRLKVDTQLVFKGRLRLNDTDFNYLNYILDDAELVN